LFARKYAYFWIFDRKKTIAIPIVESSFPQFVGSQPQVTAKAPHNDGKFLPEVDESASLEADGVCCRARGANKRRHYLLFHPKISARRLRADAAGAFPT